MKGIIFCGEIGRELQPITYSLPKQLVPIANKPLLCYTIELLLKSGITDIAIIVNDYAKPIFEKVLGEYFEISFQYIIQKNYQDIIQGLLAVEEFINREKFLMVLGDNTFEFDLKNFILDFITSEYNCKILLKEVENPEQFDVAYIGDNTIINLEEKPKIAFSNLAITGIYVFDNNIFKACKELKALKSETYNIISTIKWLLHNKYDVAHEILDGHWESIKTPSNLIEENINRLDIMKESIKGEVVNSQIVGKINLEEGAVIYNSIIRGPISIGKNSTIKHSYVGPYTSIGKGVKVDNSNVENSIILDSCIISGVTTPIDYSIIGEGSMVTSERGLKKVNKLVIGRNSKVYLL